MSWPSSRPISCRSPATARCRSAPPRARARAPTLPGWSTLNSGRFAIMPAPYRADHVGSLLRPPEVLEAHEARSKGQISPEQLREIEDRAILTALELQRQVGLDVVTDGEYRRSSWAGDFSDAVEGYVASDVPVTFDWRM